MKNLFLLFYLFPLLSPADNVIDLLKNKNNSFALQKELKKDIGSLFPSFNKPYEFIESVEKENFKKALDLWLGSINKTSFSKNSTGEALYSYLLFRSGFDVFALKNLLDKSVPKEIHSIVRSLWKTKINKKSPVWEYFFYPLHQSWQDFFDEDTIFKIGSKALFQLEGKKAQDYTKFLLTLPVSDTLDVFSLEWSFVLHLIQKEDMSSATKILAWLLSKTKDQNKKDLIYLTIGRLLADIGEIKVSLSYYSKIKNPSYFWLLAQEEKSWLFFNGENYSKAYSTASAFEYPTFKKELNPYMFFVLALTQLNYCDYKGVSRSLLSFKKIFSKREQEIRNILKSKSYKNVIKQLLEFYNSKKNYYDLGQSSLSYYLKKDDLLRNHIQLYSYMKNKKEHRTIKVQTLNQIENQIKSSLEDRIKSRIQVLLSKEIEKITLVLTNFYIIEAEMLYRIHAFHPFSSVKLEKIYSPFLQKILNPLLPTSKKVLSFPFSPDEIWLDELSAYKTKTVKSCPKENFVL